MSWSMARMVRWSLGILLLVSLSSCSTDSPSDTSGPANYPAPTSPTNVLEALRQAWENQDQDQIAELLADDFVFHLLPRVAMDHGIEQWGRSGELAACAALFDAPTVRSIRIDFESSTEQGVNELGRESERRVDVFQGAIELEDLSPPDPELYVYQAIDHIQIFYFRQGRTADDTSATATRWYLTEWFDMGRPSGKGIGGDGVRVRANHPDHPLPVSPISWSELKLLHGVPTAR